jgi:glutamate-ammonia-ligase adenylyltransferase
LAEWARGRTAPIAVRALLEAAFGNSPYLARLALREQEFLARALAAGPAEALTDIFDGLGVIEDAESETAAMSLLRRAKRQTALVVALADIAGVWTVAQVTGALSDFADRALAASLRGVSRFAPGVAAKCNHRRAARAAE